MTTIQPGEQVHALASGLTIPTGGGFTGAAHVTKRGETITVSSALIEASKNRLGEIGWPAVVHDPEAQLRKWGTVYFAPGPAPDDVVSWEHGSHEWQVSRDFAMAAAGAEIDPAERARKMAEVRRVYGGPPSTQRSGAPISAGEQRRAAEQEKRLAATGRKVSITSTEIPYPFEAHERREV